MGQIYFNDADFPAMKNEYVLWIDIMGTKNSMSSSVRTSSIFIFKLHVAIMEAITKDICVYPMMDGAYVTTKNEKSMATFIKKVFNSLSDTLINTGADFHKFLVKGAIAYGPIIHGKDIPASCSKCLEKNKDYTKGILLGMPMIFASKGEKDAPPFGIYCDESARMVSQEFAHRWYKWFTDEKVSHVANAVQSYFDYAKEHYYELDYPKEKISEHEEKATQYFRP